MRMSPREGGQPHESERGRPGVAALWTVPPAQPLPAEPHLLTRRAPPAVLWPLGVCSERSQCAAKKGSVAVLGSTTDLSMRSGKCATLIVKDDGPDGSV